MDEVETNSNYDANSNANEYNALSECLPASCPCQATNWPQY